MTISGINFSRSSNPSLSMKGTLGNISQAESSMAGSQADSVSQVITGSGNPNNTIDNMTKAGGVEGLQRNFYSRNIMLAKQELKALAESQNLAKPAA